MDIIETRTLEPVAGFDLRADLVPDYEDDELGLIVTASRAGIDLGSDSIWMTSETIIQGDGDSFAHGYGPDLIAEAVSEATAKLAELRAR